MSDFSSSGTKVLADAGRRRSLMQRDPDHRKGRVRDTALPTVYLVEGSILCPLTASVLGVARPVKFERFQAAEVRITTSTVVSAVSSHSEVSKGLGRGKGSQALLGRSMRLKKEAEKFFTAGKKRGACLLRPVPSSLWSVARWLLVLAVVGACLGAFAGPASAAHVIDAYCSPTGDYCTGVYRGTGRMV